MHALLILAAAMVASAAQGGEARLVSPVAHVTAIQDGWAIGGAVLPLRQRVGQAGLPDPATTSAKPARPAPVAPQPKSAQPAKPAPPAASPERETMAAVRARHSQILI